MINELPATKRMTKPIMDEEDAYREDARRLRERVEHLSQALNGCVETIRTVLSTPTMDDDECVRHLEVVADIGEEVLNEK